MDKSNTLVSNNIRNKFSGLFFLLLSIILFVNHSAAAQNNPPIITWCPFELQENHCNTFVFDFDAYDTDGDSLTFHIASGPGSIDPITGLWWWNWATLSEVGSSIYLEVSVSDGEDVVTCGTNVIVTNVGPILSCPAASVTVQAGDTKTQTVGATDDCDPLVFSITDIGGATGATYIDGNGVITYSPTMNDGALVQPIVMTVDVTDGDQTAYCNVSWNVILEATYRISLGELDDSSSGVKSNAILAIPGKFNVMHVGIDKVNVNAGFGGFDLQVVYDASFLFLFGAEQGNIYDDCGWEYFTYRVVNAGQIHLIGIAETNDGPNHPGCATPTPYVNELPTTLASITFLAADSSVVSGHCVPIRFYWVDCNDNILSDSYGDELLAANVFDTDDPTPINNPAATLPTLLGVPQICVDLHNTIRQVDYNNGQFCFAPDCHSGDRSVRGDINDNCFPFEMADAVMFKNYFLIGLKAFEDHVNLSIAASDANADGNVLSLADFIYLIRVFIGDAPAFPIVEPVHAFFLFDDGVMTIIGSNDFVISAAHVVVSGNATPVLLAQDMDMDFVYNAERNETSILVSTPIGPLQPIEGFTDEFLQVSGDLVEVPKFATVEGAPVSTSLIPSTFKLSQNYPNPFNPTTIISIWIGKKSDYKLTIVNALGQVIEVITGKANPSIIDIKWDATGLASGVYFYKMEAGGFTATKKAVLLK